MSDRIHEDSQMADMVLRMIRTTGDVSVNLSLNIFDKQISLVVLYGSAIWATPKSIDLLNMPAGLANWILARKGGYFSV